MTGRRGTEKRRLTQAVTVRMDEELLARCSDAADAKELSVASWLRSLAADALCIEQGPARLSRPRAKVKPRADNITRRLVDAVEHMVAVSEALRIIDVCQIEDTEMRDADLSALSGATRKAVAAVVAAIELWAGR